MNDQQIEAAARKLCELRGVDPDERQFIIGWSLDGEPTLGQAAWHNAATEIRARLQMDEAIAAGRAHDPEYVVTILTGPMPRAPLGPDDQSRMR